MYYSKYVDDDVIRSYTNGISTKMIEIFDEKIENLKNTLPDS